GTRIWRLHLVALAIYVVRLLHAIDVAAVERRAEVDQVAIGTLPISEDQPVRPVQSDDATLWNEVEDLFPMLVELDEASGVVLRGEVLKELQIRLAVLMDCPVSHWIRV